MTRYAFDATVAARTRAAKQILESSELLAKYVALGGLPRDLEAVRDKGVLAEAANLGQSESKSEGKVATVDVLASFASLQKEYSAVMAVVQAVRGELVRGGGADELVTRLDDILANEAPLTVKTTIADGGEKARKATRAMSQEALRAEIAKDAGAILALPAVHGALAERRVGTDRLSSLMAAAEELSGKLAARASAKGAGKTATQIEREAISVQRAVWGGSYRILAMLGAEDTRVRSLLGEASAQK